MPTWLIDYGKPILWLLIVLVILGSIGGSYWMGSRSGRSNCELKQAVATVKVNEKLKKDDEKIDHAVPDGTDRAVAVEFLLNHTRQ